MPRLILIGGGGHARVVGEALRTTPTEYVLAGFVDDQDTTATATILGIPQLGPIDALAQFPDDAVVLAIGAVGGVGIRPDLVERAGRDRDWPTIVHANAYVASSATIGPGTVVLPGAIVHSGADVGAFCVVNSGVIVEHDVVVGDHSMLAPGVTVGGAVVIGREVSVGLGANIRDGVTVGDRAVVAMGAVIVCDVASNSVTFGAARPSL